MQKCFDCGSEDIVSFVECSKKVISEGNGWGRQQPESFVFLCKKCYQKRGGQGI
jgi:hypothetical protein